MPEQPTANGKHPSPTHAHTGDRGAQSTAAVAAWLAVVAVALWLVQVDSGFSRRAHNLDLRAAEAFMVDPSATGASERGLLAWTGERPLEIRLAYLQPGDRIRLKLLADRPRVAVEVRLDGDTVGELVVSDRWQRYDLVLPVGGALLGLHQPSVTPGRIHLSQILASNTLSYSDRYPEVYVVRDLAGRASRPFGWRPLAVMFWCLLLAPAVAVGATRRRLHGTARRLALLGLGLVVLATAQLASILGGVRLVVPSATFVTVVAAPLALAAALGVARAALRWARERWSPVRARSAASRVLTDRSLQLVLVVVAATAAWGVVLAEIAADHWGSDIRGFARFKRDRMKVEELVGVPAGENGYDGQFYAAMATDPLLRDPDTRRSIDAPAYRGRRMLVPAAAWLVALGDKGRAVTVYVVLCWVLALPAAAVVGRWLVEDQASPLWTLTALFSLGVAASVTRATPDAAAAALIMAALWVDRTRRGGVALALAAAATLARETSILACAALALVAWREGRRRWAALYLAVPAALLGGWALLVQRTVSLGRVVAGGSANLGIPLAWLPAKVERILAQPAAGQWMEVPGILGVLAAFAAAGALAMRWRRIDAAQLSLVAFAALGLALNMRVYVEAYAYGRVLIVLPLLAVVSAPRIEWRGLRWLLLAVAVLWTVSGIALLRLELPG